MNPHKSRADLLERINCPKLEKVEARIEVMLVYLPSDFLSVSLHHCNFYGVLLATVETFQF